MSNQKFYLDGGGNRVWLPTMGAIWHVRDNEVLHDYADTRKSEADYGAGLAEALGAGGPTTFTAGDKLVIGAGRFQADQLTCAVSNVVIELYGTIIEALTATTFDNVIELTGNAVHVKGMTVEIGSAVTDFAAGIEVSGTDCKIENCLVDGLQTPNAGAGNGILINTGADRAKVTNCRAVDLDGSSVFQGRGLYVLSSDTVIEGFRAEDCKYIGIRASNADRLTIRNAEIINSGATNGAIGAGQNNPRSIEIDGSDHDYVSLESVTCYSDTPKGQAYIGFNTGGTISDVTLDNVKIVNKDNVSAGVSYDYDAQRMQTLKVQNCTNLHARNCKFLHGSNQGAGGTAYAFSYDATFPRNAKFEGCTISGGIFNMGSSSVQRLTFDDCQFGAEHMSEGRVMPGIGNGRITFKGCHVNLRDGARAFDIGNGGTVGSDDYIKVVDCDFEANNASDVYLFENELDDDLLSHPRRVICYGNTLTNDHVSGDFLKSSDADIYLLLSTDRSGDMLYDSSDANMPSPGAGPYFTGVPGILGQKIINVRWNGTGIQFYVFNGTNWIDSGV